MLYCLLTYYLLENLSWFTTQNASNLGTFLSGIGTLLIAILGVIGIRSLSLWRKQKYEEKSSEVAANILKDLPKQEHLYWLRCALFAFNNDINKEGYRFVDKIHGIKDFAKTLLNNDLNELFDDLEENAKLAANSIAAISHVSANGESKAIAYTDFNNAKKIIEESYENIQKKLHPYIMFKNEFI